MQPPQFPSISAIVPALKLGDEVAWNDLCEKFRLGLTYKTKFLIKNSRLVKKFGADDLVQETFLKAWRSRESFRGDQTSQFSKWILTILRNTFCDWARGMTLESTFFTWHGLSHEQESPSSAMMSLELEAHVQQCIAELDPLTQQILALRHYEGLKFREIAEVTKQNPNSIATIYRRAILNMSRKMR